jgi:hypothetical protein
MNGSPPTRAVPQEQYVAVATLAVINMFMYITEAPSRVCSRQMHFGAQKMHFGAYQ